MLLIYALPRFFQDNFLPPSQRNNYDCEKDPTGPLNRKKLIEHINKQALETPDRPEVKPFVAGVVRGKKVRFYYSWLETEEDQRVPQTLKSSLGSKQSTRLISISFRSRFHSFVGAGCVVLKFDTSV